MGVQADGKPLNFMLKFSVNPKMLFKKTLLKQQQEVLTYEISHLTLFLTIFGVKSLFCM